MQAIALDSGTTPSIRTIETLLERIKAGEMHPMDALNQLVEDGAIEIREGTPEDWRPPRAPTLLDITAEIGLSAHAFRGPSSAAPRRMSAQQVEYVGSQGRGKVTFGTGEAIVSRLKPNGSWKIVARHPWPETNECRVNATLQTICGPDFYIKED